LSILVSYFLVVGSFGATTYFFLDVGFFVETGRPYIILIVGSCVVVEITFICFYCWFFVTTIRYWTIGRFKPLSCMDIGVNMDKNGEGMLWNINMIVNVDT